MIKKIYAIVSEKDFYRFRKRAYSENLTLGEAFTSLALAYGKGEISISHVHNRNSKNKPLNVYLEDHKAQKNGGKENHTDAKSNSND